MPSYFATTTPRTRATTAALSTPANLADYYTANQSRIPGGVGLETQSSEAISGLLNPPAMFPDVNRQAAEVTAGRGIGGSAAAYGTGLRMTDEERLRRIALGEQLLSGAYARQPALPADFFGLTPYQSAMINLRDRELEQARLTGGRNPTGYGGGGGGYPDFSGIGIGGRAGAMSAPWSAGVSPQDLGLTDWYGTRPSEPADVFVPGGGYPDPGSALLPLYPGGPVVGGGGGGYSPGPIPGFGDYGDAFSAGGNIAGLENLGGGATDFSGLLDYYSGG